MSQNAHSLLTLCCLLSWELVSLFILMKELTVFHWHGLLPWKRVWEINPGLSTEGFGPISIKHENIIFFQGRRIIIIYCLLMNSVMTALHGTLDSSKWLLYLRSQIYFAHVRHYFHSWSSRTLCSESKIFHQTM